VMTALNRAGEAVFSQISARLLRGKKKAEGKRLNAGGFFFQAGTHLFARFSDNIDHSSHPAFAA